MILKYIKLITACCMLLLGNRAIAQAGFNLDNTTQFVMNGVTQVVLSGGADLKTVTSQISIGGGTLTISGVVQGTGNFIGTNTSSLILNNTGNGTLNFAAGSNVLNNFTLDRSGSAITLNTPLTISGLFNLQNGVLNTSVTNLLTLGTSGAATGTLNYSSGQVNGPFQRWYAAATNSGTSGDFPIGNGITLYNPKIEFTTAPTSEGTLTAQWLGSVPGNAGLPLTDGSISLTNTFNTGYWKIDAANGLTGGLYKNSLAANDFSGISSIANLRIVKRPSAGGNWVLDGTAGTNTGTASNPVIVRNGMSGFSEFAVALSCSINLTSAFGTDAQNICSGSSITDITYTTSGATGATVTGLPTGVTGSWAADVLTISGTPTVFGTYNYTVTQVGGACAGTTATGTISITNVPTPTITAGGPTTFCTSGSVVLTSSTATDYYLWSTGEITQSITVTTGGNYTITVGSGGCTSSLSAATNVTVSSTPTVSNAGPNINACINPGTSTLAGNVPSVGTGVWSQVPGGPSTAIISSTSNATTNIFGLTTAGVYKFVWTISNGACTPSRDTVDITVNPSPSAFALTGAGTFCPGTTILTGPSDPNYTYAWERSLTGIANPNSFTTFGGIGSSQAVTSSGIYRLIVTNQFGCTATDTAAVSLADFVFNGTLGAGDAQQTGRMFRSAVVSTCASPTAYPGIFTATGSRYYDSYTITNIRNTPVCATIGLTSNCGTSIFGAAYLGSFSPTNFSTNYLADFGSSFPGTAFMEATIPANATIEIVVHEVNTGTGCGGYQLNVDVPRDLAAITATPSSVVFNSTSTLAAPVAATYVWNPGSGITQSITTAPITANGTKYFATLRYGNAGCTRLDSVVVNLSCTLPVLTCPTNTTVAACQTQAAVNTAFATWLATASGSGGTSGVLTNNNTGAPSACGGSTTVTFTYTNTCPPLVSTCQATFTVATAPTVVLTCPINTTAAACQTQAAVNTAFATWLATVSASGGCNGVLTNNNTGAPSACGGSTTVTFTYTSNCAPLTTTCQATFTVATAPTVVLTCPTNTTAAACQTQAAVNTAFATWLATASASGGCNGVLTNNNTGAPSACGGSTTVTFTYTSNCAPLTTTCQATFTVATPPTIVITCPAPTTVTCVALIPSPNVNSVTIGAGCNVTVTFRSDVISNQTCANKYLITRTYRGTDLCGNFVECTQLITVNDNIAPTITCPVNITVCGVANVPIANTASVTATDNCVGAVAITNQGDAGTPSTTAPYVITRTYRATDVCGNFSECTQLITVNPIATVTAVANQVICNNNATTAVTFGTTATGGTVVYNWTNNTTSIGLAAAGSGNIPSFTATNTTTAPVTATITVTPSYTNAGVTCVGTPITYTYKVNPTPTVNVVSNQTICNGASTTAVNFTGTVAGTVFSWTNNNTAIGLVASGTGNIASFTATNTTTAPVTATITVTPSTPGSGLIDIGSPFNMVSYSGNVGIIYKATLTGTNAGGSIWGTNTYTNDSYLALAAVHAGVLTVGQTGVVYIEMLNGLSNYPSTLQNGITSSPYGSWCCSYRFVNAPTSSNPTCTGTPRTFTITVNPTATVNAIANQVVCNNAATTAVTFGTTATGGTVVYNWTNNTTSIGLAAAGTGNIPSFTATNTTTAPVTATITVTPSYTNAGVTCVGTPRTYTYTVNPTATVTAVANQVICNNAPTTAVTFTSPTTGGTIVYNWTNNTTSIGLAAAGTGNIPSFTATNTTTAPVTATITVTPSYTNAGVTCVGTPITYTYTVNPTATVNPIANQVLCNNFATTAVNFSSPATGGTIVYNWTNTAPSIGLAASGTGNIPTFTATNTTQAPVVATISITASFTNGGVTCTGPAQTFTITVNPTPIVTLAAFAPICKNAPAITLTGGLPLVTAGTTGTYTVDNVTQTSFNPANYAPGLHTIVYTYTNIYGCVNSATQTILLHPIHTVEITLAPNTGVSPGSPVTAIATVSPVDNYTYAWSKNNASIITSPTNTDRILIQANDAGNYKVTVTAPTGCVVTSANIFTPSNVVPTSLFVFPNPSTGLFNVSYNNGGSNLTARTLNVYDALGQKVYTKRYDVNVPFGNMQVDLRNKAAGMYAIELLDSNGKKLGINRVIKN